MPAQTTATSPQQLIGAAKALLLAYNDKKWDAIKTSITPDFDYDEVGTGRKVKGADQTIALMKGWAAAIPDSKATIHSTCTSGNTVIFEVTWTGTHKGPLQTPKGAIPATGKKIDVRACIVHEIAGDKVKEERHYFDLMTLLSQIGVA
jgi:steroid delta-isomerase-like uncharacterized protein